ncbi:transmembrane protein 216 isoform X1 [Heterocephalus glaber]|uniref:Transmembrane protein 216 n=1 Tax=Heterocephalus glaber TaxID=10181 RepID=A0AAX6QEU3_HETGA|nr:transmembrane protein 216 isoform X1 [Heterocephalus glaber]
MAPRGKRLSSTPLEILFFLNGWYYATYFLLELFIFLYKGLLLPYPTANLVLDVVMLLLYLGIEVIRLLFGTKGNLCQRKMPLGISVALTFPSAMMAAYYLLLQTYVLRLEAIMNGILLVFCGSELLLEYGQDLKCKSFSPQHMRLTAPALRSGGSRWLGKGRTASHQHQHLGIQPNEASGQSPNQGHGLRLLHSTTGRGRPAPF